MFPEGYDVFVSMKLEGIGSNYVTDSRVDSWEKRAVQYLLDNPEEDYWKIATGDTTLIALRTGNDIEVIVAKNYWRKTVKDLTNEV